MLVPLYLDFDGKWMRLGGDDHRQRIDAGVQGDIAAKPKRVALNAFDVLALESASRK
jgi:hypothetical protein